MHATSTLKRIKRSHVLGIQEGLDLEELVVHPWGGSTPVVEPKLSPALVSPPRGYDRERALIYLPPQSNSLHLDT